MKVAEEDGAEATEEPATASEDVEATAGTHDADRAFRLALLIDRDSTDRSHESRSERGGFWCSGASRFPSRP